VEEGVCTGVKEGGGVFRELALGKPSRQAFQDHSYLKPLIPRPTFFLFSSHFIPLPLTINLFHQY
jgi:hypothetical protein